MAKYRILSLDGGGIRGVLTARLLQRIETERPDFLAGASLFAGTSTGSILAVALAKGLTPVHIVDLYRQQGKVIFHDSIFHEIGGLWGLASARYGTQARYDGIHPAIGDIVLDDLLPKNVLVASFQLDSENPILPDTSAPRAWKAKFFHNFPGPDSDGHEKAMDVIMRSSAAPTYFPIYEGFVDGAVVANNPSMCALAQAIEPQTGKQNIKDVVLMSVGTGVKREYLASRDGHWGLKQWGLTLIDLVLEGGSGLADYQCRQLLGDCYTRLNPDLHQNIALDGVNQIDTLIGIADGVALKPWLDWIDTQWTPDS